MPSFSKTKGSGVLLIIPAKCAVSVSFSAGERSFENRKLWMFSICGRSIASVSAEQRISTVPIRERLKNFMLFAKLPPVMTMVRSA